MWSCNGTGGRGHLLAEPGHSVRPSTSPLRCLISTDIIFASRERIIKTDAGAGGVVGYFTSATSVTLIWMNWPL